MPFPVLTRKYHENLNQNSRKSLILDENIKKISKQRTNKNSIYDYDTATQNLSEKNENIFEQ